jgi:pimeloyl-ACP methyl ester carboxylesterase
VVTWDQRGFGRTTNRASEPSPANAVQDLGRVLDHLGIARTHLIAQSMGGWAAVGFALAHPERVRSLVLSGTIAGIYTPVVEREFDAFLRRAGGLRVDGLPLGRHPAVSDSLVDRDPALAFLYQQMQSLNDAPPLQAGALLRGTAYDHAALARIAVPVLFIVGSEDPIFPPAAIRDAATKIPGARVLEIAGSGHSPYFEKPREWNAAVREFLR